MKFHRVIGKIDPVIVSKAEKALSKVFLELGLRPGNEHIGTAMGGDPLIFSLLYPMQHIATLNMPTAGTDGKRYYWNPKFVNSKSRIGLRIVCAHEAWHAIYMHPTRRGSRHAKLWNIAVDFIVNWTIMQDIKSRKMDPVSTFIKELGNFVTLEIYADHLRNPFVKIKGSENWIPEPEDLDEEVIVLPKIDDDRELTDKEKKELSKRKAKVKYFFADPNLPENMRRPERIYDYLLNLLPKCPKCGRIGMYKLPEGPSAQDKPEEQPEKNNETEQEESTEKEKHDHDEDDHNHGEGDECCDDSCSHDHDNETNDSDEDGDREGDQPGNKPGTKPGECNHGCDSCGGWYDIFGFGDTLDEHMDASETPEKMAKRIADAMEAAKKMAGSVPASLEDELGALLAPKIRWQDFLRAKISKVRDGNSRNDWTRFRTRPLFAGLMIPKRINQICTFGCLLDTSGSMTSPDMTFGVSQLQSIDERSEGLGCSCRCNYLLERGYET
ncbi:unnamed protein product [Sphagnum jensenii]|uniref:Putative metallopeptidase domain-containing protein n=1 Tax=Sphagnum jensenii TaxID=128206 RepID=A0ABP0VDN1_9BRYO